MQTRGEHVMGVNQYTSAHVFEELADGGRVVLERADASDTADITTIRAHMRDIAAAFRAGAREARPCKQAAEREAGGDDQRGDRDGGGTFPGPGHE